MTKRSNIVPLRKAAGETDRPVALAERHDDELMLLARGGTGAAFDEIVRRHQRRILRIAAKHLGSETEARDVAQRTFIELFRALPRYRARGKFSAYLYRIALNQCRMACRTRARRAEDFRGEGPIRSEANAGRPDDEVIAAERRREIDRAVAELSVKLRDVVVLRFAGELSYREIAEVLRIPVGTVKSRLPAAFVKLAKILGEQPK